MHIRKSGVDHYFVARMNPLPRLFFHQSIVLEVDEIAEPSVASGGGSVCSLTLEDGLRLLIDPARDGDAGLAKDMGHLGIAEA
jgi:hypothetical protein